MSTITIRPTSLLDKDNGLNGTSNSGSTYSSATDAQIATYLGDNSDTTGVRSSGSGSRYYQLAVATPTIPTDEFIARVGGFLRWSAAKAGKYIGCSPYKISQGVPGGVSALATSVQLTPLTSTFGYISSASYYPNWDGSGMAIAIHQDGDSTSGNRPVIWDAGVYVYTLKRATAAPQATTVTTTTYATIPVDVTATIDWEAGTYAWQNLRKVTVELRVESGGNGVGTGTLISTITKDIYFDATGTVTTNVTLTDSLPNGSYKTYARAIRHRENETEVASDQIGAWSSAATLTMSMWPPATPTITVAAEDASARVKITATPISRTNLITNPSFETNTTGWGAVGTSSAVRSTAASYSNTASYLLTTNATGVAGPYFNNGGSRVAVTAGLAYSFSIYAKDVNTAVQYKAGIDWYNSGGTQIGSTSWGSNTSISTTDWTRVSVTATAPVGAVTAVVLCYSATTPVTAKTIYFDAALFEQSSSVGTYFETVSYSSPYITVERSDDSGLTWTSVRNLTAVSASFGVDVVRYDYEAPRGQVVYYRAKTSAYTASVMNTSEPSSPGNATLTETTWNLKCPEDPTLNYVDVTIVGKPSEDIDEDMGVFRPDGRRYPVVVAGTLSGWDGELSIVASSETEWNKLKALIESQKVLYLESPFGWHKYIRLVKGAKTTMEGTPTAQRRRISATYVETLAPSGSYAVTVVTVTYDFGIASTVTWDNTIDCGLSTTTSFSDAIDGGAAY